MPGFKVFNHKEEIIEVASVSATLREVLKSSEISRMFSNKESEEKFFKTLGLSYKETLDSIFANKCRAILRKDDVSVCELDSTNVVDAEIEAKATVLDAMATKLKKNNIPEKIFDKLMEVSNAFLSDVIGYERMLRRGAFENDQNGKYDMPYIA